MDIESEESFKRIKKNICQGCVKGWGAKLNAEKSKIMMVNNESTKFEIMLVFEFKYLE